MYFIVKLTPSAEKKIVPVKWIQNLDIVHLWNNGINSVKRNVFKVFISENISEEPDFLLAVRELPYDDTRPACYNATIVKSCGKYFSSERTFHIRKSFSAINVFYQYINLKI